MNMTNYNWDKEADFAIKGDQFELLYNFINTEVQKEASGQPVNNFIRMDMLRESFNVFNKMLQDGIESGVVKEVLE